jgi:hypothetical protein
MSTPRKLPVAVVDVVANTLSLDGVEFPWPITSEGISIHGLGHRDAMPTLCFSIFADSVHILNAEVPPC